MFCEAFLKAVAFSALLHSGLGRAQSTAGTVSGMPSPLATQQASTTTSSVSLASSVLAASPTVTILHYGVVQGNRSAHDKFVYQFKGMHFGGAPTGDYRWKHAPHPDPWDGIKDATSFGPPCPQTGVDNYSEDCLHLNVYTPHNATFNDVTESTAVGTFGVVPTDSNSKFAVYVYIHGGGYSGGSNSLAMYDGAGLAAKGIIVVTINYRLGALGFMAHPELSANSSSGTSGNYGLVDQQAALHWVHENIAGFGGDPDRVTVGGQSAGAGSSIDQMFSGEASGLLNQVISQSGIVYPSNPLQVGVPNSYRLEHEAEQDGVAYLKSINCSSITEARSLPVTDFIVGMNAADYVYADSLFANDSTIYYEPPTFRPVLDGYILPATYYDLLKTGNHNIVPVMTGNVKDENGGSPDPGFSVKNYTSINQHIFGSKGLAREFFSLFPAGNTSEEADASSNRYYRSQSRISTWLWANLYSQGAEANVTSNGANMTAADPSEYDVYTYFWTHAPPNQTRGAYHASEIQYTFNNLWADGNWEDADYKIADTMSDYWVNYIKTGNPNGVGLAKWPVNSERGEQTMELGDAFKAIPVGTKEEISFVKQWFSKWPLL